MKFSHIYRGLNGASQVMLEVKNRPANTGNIRDAGIISVSGRSAGGGHGNPLQYSCLENPMDRGASLVGYSPWGHKESDTTERLNTRVFWFLFLLS